jgi:hypothetical protein
MMYLALAVRTPGDSQRGLMSYQWYGITTRPSDVTRVLNYESTLGKSAPFSAVETALGSEPSFDANLETEIGHYHIPAMVGVQTNQLPSHAEHGEVGDHWISVVGYDGTYFYYVETCTGSTGCGSAATDESGPAARTENARYDPGSFGDPGDVDPYIGQFQGGTSLSYRRDARYLYTWRIGKADLFTAANHLALYYIKDAGLKAVTPGGR